MVVVKNINNNVSLCRDGNGKEVIVFGKGVGFLHPPAEVPLSKIERTFYNVSSQYLSILNDVPQDVLDFTARIIEEEMALAVRRDTFNYARFATRVQYLLRRIFEDKSIDSENIQMYQSIREEYEAASRCVDRIAAYLKENWKAELTEEEKLYLIMYVNRVCAKEME